MRPRREYSDFLHDMLDAADKAKRIAQGVDLHTFLDDEEKGLAATRALEIIGEAARRLPKSLRDRHPEVPWADIIAMRNKVVHEYFGVDLEVVWRTVQDDLPALREAVARIVAELERRGGNA